MPMHGEMATLLTTRFATQPHDHPADFVLPREATPAELVERVRILTARKRGPKKHPQAAATAATTERMVA